MTKRDEIRLYPFEKHPEIAMPNTPEEREGKVSYKTDYKKAIERIKSEPDKALGYVRWLVLNDLWFVAYFILPLPESVKQKLNNPFTVGYAKEIQEGPESYTLDIVAREHFKSSLMTIAETVQYTMRNPDKSTAIFSYARSVAKRFLREIKGIFESTENDGCRLLRAAFPDVLWNKPASEAPKWSEDDGLVLRRSIERRESTIEAWGLVEGMPTGGHFDRRIYDDIVTEDIAESPDIMEKVKLKFDSSQNLGIQEGGVHRVIGTIYAYDDPLCYIRDIINPLTGKGAYYLRRKPATENGEPNGKPVFLSQKRLDELKLTRTYYCQQLLNPVPAGTARLDAELLRDVEPEFIPYNLHKIMLIDPAGDQETQKGSDSWAILIVGIEPDFDNAGASNVYILNAVIDSMTHSAAIETITKMYLSSGIIEKVCVEKVAMSTVEVHVKNALEKRGRRISIDDGSLVLLKPAGRSKQIRIEQALQWPLNNGKLHISKSIASSYRDRIRQEMRLFPKWSRDDAMDALSYVYDVIRDNPFMFRGSKEFNRTLKYETVGIV